MEDKAKHFVGEVAQKAIIEYSGSVLFVRGNSSQESWDLPGGRLCVDENAPDALKREVKEETGLDIEVLAPICVQQIHKPEWKLPRCFVFYGARLLNPASTIVLQEEELYEAKWIPTSELDSLQTWDAWRSAVQAFLAQK